MRIAPEIDSPVGIFVQVVELAFGSVIGRDLGACQKFATLVYVTLKAPCA